MARVALKFAKHTTYRAASATAAGELVDKEKCSGMILFEATPNVFCPPLNFLLPSESAGKFSTILPYD